MEEPVSVQQNKTGGKREYLSKQKPQTFCLLFDCLDLVFQFEIITNCNAAEVAQMTSPQLSALKIM